MTRIDDLAGKAVPSELSGYITGNMIHVNGGMYMP
jgi:hypothetical protein